MRPRIRWRNRLRYYGGVLSHGWRWAAELLGGSQVAAISALVLIVCGLAIPSGVFDLFPPWLAVLVGAAVILTFIVEGGYRQAEARGSVGGAETVETVGRLTWLKHNVTDAGNGWVEFELGDEANREIAPNFGATLGTVRAVYFHAPFDVTVRRGDEPVLVKFAHREFIRRRKGFTLLEFLPSGFRIDEHAKEVRVQATLYPEGDTSS